jgi:hypothetical protein
MQQPKDYVITKKSKCTLLLGCAVPTGIMKGLRGPGKTIKNNN